MQQRVSRHRSVAAGHMKCKHTPRKADSCLCPKFAGMAPGHPVARGLRISTSRKRQAARYVSVSVRQAAARLRPAGCSAAGHHADWRCCRGDRHLKEKGVWTAAASSILGGLQQQSTAGCRAMPAHFAGCAASLAGCTVGKVTVVCASNWLFSRSDADANAVPGYRREEKDAPKDCFNYDKLEREFQLLLLLPAAALDCSALACSGDVALPSWSPALLTYCTVTLLPCWYLPKIFAQALH